MNSKERTIAAILRQHPDRTPCDFLAELPALNRLFEHVGHRDKECLLRNLGVDVRHLDAKTPPEIELGNGLFQNYWGERYIYKKTPWGKMREDAHGALNNAESFADIEGFNWPSVDSFDYSDLAEQCRRYEDYAIVYGFADVWFRPTLVRGLELSLIHI